MAFALQFSSCTRRKCTLIDANKTRQFERRWMNNKSVFREIVEKIDRFYDQPRRFDYPRENECLLTRVYCKCLLISCTLIWSCHFVRKRHKSGFSSIFLRRMRAMKKITFLERGFYRSKNFHRNWSNLLFFLPKIATLWGSSWRSPENRQLLVQRCWKLTQMSQSLWSPHEISSNFSAVLILGLSGIPPDFSASINRCNLHHYPRLFCLTKHVPNLSPRINHLIKKIQQDRSTCLSRLFAIEIWHFPTKLWSWHVQIGWRAVAPSKIHMRLIRRLCCVAMTRMRPFFI